MKTLVACTKCKNFIACVEPMPGMDVFLDVMCGGCYRVEVNNEVDGHLDDYILERKFGEFLETNFLVKR